MPKLAINGGEPVTRDLVGRSQLTYRHDRERKNLLRVYDSGIHDDWPGEKSEAARFAEEFAQFNSSKFCALVTNGTHSLQLALESLDIGHGDEVIVPGLTWQATASVVCDVNAVPVFVDVEPDTLCIDTTRLEAAITPRTRAIMPVHLYYRMADMDAVLGIAQKHNLHVIEDAAHAHGSQWDGRAAGSLGVFGSFSFQSSKVLRGGEGGALITDSEDLYWKVVSQRSCGREYKAGVRVHSGNYRITSFQAAVLRGQLDALKNNAATMDRNGRALDDVLQAAPGVHALRRSPHLTRQTGYSFCFLYNPREYDGVPGDVFRKALSAELSWEFTTTYTPLHHSELYTPHLKKRHALSPEYVKAITPSRWSLPVAEDLWKDRAVVSAWAILGLAPTRAHLLADAIEKIHANRAELAHHAGA